MATSTAPSGGRPSDPRELSFERNASVRPTEPDPIHKTPVVILVLSLAAATLTLAAYAFLAPIVAHTFHVWLPKWIEWPLLTWLAVTAGSLTRHAALDIQRRVKRL